MKPFDINLAKQGHPVCTRDGRKARIVTYDKKGIYSIVALVEDGEDEETVMLYNSHGRISKPNGGLDLMLASVKHEGWVIVFANGELTGQVVYKSKEDALKVIGDNEWCVAKIEWEE